MFYEDVLMRNTSIRLPLETKKKGEKQKGFTEASLMCCSFPASSTECLSCGVLLPRDELLILGDTESPCWVHSGAQDSTFTLLFFSFPLDFDCSNPLGMESGEITSDQIMASSQYNPSWSPERSRLNYYENAWTPAEDSNKEWIQVPRPFSCHTEVTVI